MVESFLVRIAETILNQIISPAIKEIALLWSNSDFERFEETMRYIHAALLDVENVQQHNETLHLTLTKLTALFYDAEDLIDDFKCEAMRKELMKHSQSVSLPSIFTRFTFPARMGLEIKRINDRLEKIAADFKRFSLGEHVQILENQPSFVERSRGTHSFLTLDVIGRNQDKDRIIDLLVQPWCIDNIPVIPIVGMGGLGKTTLAQFVFNDGRINQHFALKLWVFVSESFDISRLIAEMIYCISKERCDGLTLNGMMTLLQSLVKGQNFLLVLDDVWNEDRIKWNELKNILTKLDVLHQSRVIVTTRSLVVATITGTERPYHLEALDHHNSLLLLLKWAFDQGGEGRYPNLLVVADDIVKKCKGVPLVVRTLGSLLSGKTSQREWELIRDNCIWKLDQIENDILPVLKLSYNHLPCHLKRCLAYLSLFPKDYTYDTDYVVQFWMVNGLLEIPGQEDDRCSEDIGLQYFKDLWFKGFFQDVIDLSTCYLFKIHDLIHDVALHVSQEECLTVYKKTASASENVRHLAFADRYPLRTLQSFLKKLKGVRTLVILTPPPDFRVIEKSFLTTCFSYFKYLRLLELERFLLEALPDSICTLKHLRYLSLTGCQNLSRLPKSIHKLQSLVTLRLFDIPKLQVPDKLQRLVNLRFLEITAADMQLREIRPGNWSSLQLLHIFKYTEKSLFEGIQYLTSLRTLFVHDCNELESLPRSLKYLVKLEELTILNCPKINLLMEPQGVEDQNLQLSLKRVIISAASNLKDLPRLLLVASISHLEFFEIQILPKFEELPDWFLNLDSLQELLILNCPKLSSLPEGVRQLTKLRYLKIEDCPTLSEKCRPQTGADWSKISHIMEVNIDDQRIIN